MTILDNKMKTPRELAHSVWGDICNDWVLSSNSHCFNCDKLTNAIQDLADAEFVKGYDQCKEEYDSGTE